MSKEIRNQKFSNNGFTLLEVMVAITIFGVVLVTLLYLLSASLSNAITNKNYTIGLLIAQSKMAEAVSYIESETAGELPVGEMQYKWISDVTSLITGGMEKVTVTVQWKEKGEPKKIELAGLRLSKEIDL